MKDLREEFENLQKEIDRLANSAESEIAKEYAKGLEKLRDIIRKKFDDYSIAGELRYSELAKYDRKKKLDKELRDAVNKLHVEASKATRNTLRSVYRNSYSNTMDMVSSVAGKTIRGEIKREVIQEALQNPVSGLTLNKRLRKNRREIITKIQETIGQGLTRGESYSQMSDRLKDTLEGDIKKANRIVRTETHRVMEQSKKESLDHADKQGVTMKKYWLNSDDERVRKKGQGNHTGMGQRYSKENTIPYGEDFVNEETGGEGPAPGLMGTARDDCNCRCLSSVIVVE